MDDQSRALLVGAALSIILQAAKAGLPKLKKLPSWGMRLLNVGMAAVAQGSIAFAQGSHIDPVQMIVLVATTYAGAEGTYQLGLKAIGDAAGALSKKE